MFRRNACTLFRHRRSISAALPFIKGDSMKSDVHIRAPSRNVVQVSLPQLFGEELRAQSDLQGRSMAAQLEHWARIAMAIEAIGPGPAVASVKTVPLNDADALRAAFASFLLAPSLDAARVATANRPSYGMSPDNPEVALRIDPDGTRTEGRYDAQGVFVANQPSTSERKNHAHPAPKEKVARKRPAPGAASARPAHAAAVAA